MALFLSLTPPLTQLPLPSDSRCFSFALFVFPLLSGSCYKAIARFHLGYSQVLRKRGKSANAPVPVGDEAPVLHGPGSKVRDSDHVLLGQRKLDLNTIIIHSYCVTLNKINTTLYTVYLSTQICISQKNPIFNYHS